MTNEKLFEALGDINERHILEAKEMKEKKPFSWVKACAMAACLCLVLGVASFSLIFLFTPENGQHGGSAFGDPGSELLTSHREDFYPEIDDAVLAQFEDSDKVLKTYWLITNQWFLADVLEDFSQVVTTDVSYVYPGDDEGNDVDTAFSVYDIDEHGKIDWVYSGYPLEGASIPHGLWKLTYEMIDSDLAGINYEDYIITKSSRLGTVFVWVRCSTGDLFLTYPTRPDLTGLEIGGIYTLEELQEILKEAKSK